MMRDLDISQLRTFLCVAEHCNMSHAANLRNLTQSAISQQIKRLEETLNCNLMLRIPNGITLTEAGLELMPFARGVVDQNDALVASMFGIVAQVDIRLGVPQDIVASLLPSALKSFTQQQPEAHITLVSDSTKKLVQLLKKRQLNLAITTDDSRVPDAILLDKIDLVWVGGKKGKAFLKRPLPVAAGPQGCSFRKAASDALTSDNLAWRPVTQVGSLEPVFATLLADIAVAPFMSGTEPAGTEIVSKGLPKLPTFYLHLRKSDIPSSLVSQQLAETLILLMTKKSTDATKSS